MSVCSFSELHSHHTLCRRAPRGTRRRTSSGLRAGRRYYRPTCLLLRPESDTCRGKIKGYGGACVDFDQRTACPCPYLSAMATAVFFSLSLLDWGALTWAMTGLRSRFISSSTLSEFYAETHVKWTNPKATALQRYCAVHGLLTLASSYSLTASSNRPLFSASRATLLMIALVSPANLSMTPG